MEEEKQAVPQGAPAEGTTGIKAEAKKEYHCYNDKEDLYLLQIGMCTRLLVAWIVSTTAR